MSWYHTNSISKDLNVFITAQIHVVSELETAIPIVYYWF